MSTHRPITVAAIVAAALIAAPAALAQHPRSAKTRQAAAATHVGAAPAPASTDPAAAPTPDGLPLTLTPPWPMQLQPIAGSAPRLPRAVTADHAAPQPDDGGVPAAIVAVGLAAAGCLVAVGAVLRRRQRVTASAI